jgi:hypothetical protein
MTLDELRGEVARAKERGHEHIQLTVRRKRQPATDSGRLWRGGPACRYVGEVEHGLWLVDVKTKAMERWLGATEETER